MVLSDSDLEFVFQMYDSAISLIVSNKDKDSFAEDVISHLVDHGFEVKDNVAELAEHCQFLSDAVDAYLEMEEEDIDIFEDSNEDDEELDW
jgi:hypothetical protein